MHRAQIIIEDWQYQVLKALAERRGTSISEVVREILADRLMAAGKEPRRRLEQIRGIGSDEAASGRHHDEYLYGQSDSQR